MRNFAAFAALAASANALVPRDTSCCFGLTASGEASGPVGQLDDGQNRIGGDLPAGQYCIDTDGSITDGNGRGCILTPPTTQFQCDEGASPSPGFSVNSNGQLEYDGSTDFVACETGQNGELNIYTTESDDVTNCRTVQLIADSCSGSGTGTGSSSVPGGGGQSSSAPQPSSSVPIVSPSPSAPGSEGPGGGSATPTVVSPSSTSPGEGPGGGGGGEGSTATPSGTSPGEGTDCSLCETTTVLTTVIVPCSSSETPGVPIPGESTTPGVPGGGSPGPSQPPSSETPGVPGESGTPGVPGGGSPGPSQPPSSETPGVPGESGTPGVPGGESPTPSGPGETQPPSTVTPGVPGESNTPGGAGSESPGPSQPPSETSPPQTSQPPQPQPSGECCQTDLSGDYEFPHLIVPVDSSSPDEAVGTSFNGTVSSTVSTIFNFDIPASDAGRTCSLVFLFPKQEDLETSAFSFSGDGKVSFGAVSEPATQSTTFNNAPTISQNLGDFTIAPGNSYAISTFECPAGQTVGYEITNAGSTSFEFFEDYNPSPLGLYITKC
ncbi:ubiquitin 3 binding protein But2 C-terminal domain-containing protein [Aspergillus pseudodeflectus]|uniref:Ubiquitin 3 binding protein But2 C-terminal domain-containing protein n=1 Tax=Aspergillus pseudodeflectus TaxID=176178 RepID=A0ABR4LB87_9EURO